MTHFRLSLATALLAALAVAGCKSNSTGPNNNNGNTGNGPVITFTATPSTILPGDSATLKWTTDNTQTSLSINQGIGDQMNNENDSILVSPATTTTYTLTAANSNGTTTKTVTVTVNNPGDPGAPPAPTGLSATQGATSPSTIDLSWTASAGATSYRIDRRLFGQAFIVIDSTATGTSYNDAGLYPGFIYTYRIRAVNAGKKSGYSNPATQTAPGMAPTISSITISPAALSGSLAPGQTQQFTAVAYDAANNTLTFGAQTYIWSSSNPSVVSVDANGLATAGTMQGSADITAALPLSGDFSNPTDTMRSNPVTVTVINHTSGRNTLVVFYGSDPAEFADYAGPLTASGVSFDTVSDYSNGGSTPQFTIDQLKAYTRVVVLFGGNTQLSDNAGSVLAEYGSSPGNTLVMINGDGDNENLINSSLDQLFGVSNDGYVSVASLGLTVTGQSGTAFAGLSFVKRDAISYVDDIELKAGSPCVPSLIGTNVNNNNAQVNIAIQGTAGTTKLLYCGCNVDFVDLGNQNAFVKDFMTY